jgi:Xaa-Pro aminopeptidase
LPEARPFATLRGIARIVENPSIGATAGAQPAPFTPYDYALRLERVARQVAEAGLTGILIGPGPDLVYLTGYAPIALTERLTMLVVGPGTAPTMIVPGLERPSAEVAAGAEALTLLDWRDGDDAYAAFAPVLERSGRYAVSDQAWALHVLGLQRERPDLTWTSLTAGLPMLRAIKDASELDRLAAAGAAADACYEELLAGRFAGRQETAVAGDLADLLIAHGHSQVAFTVVGSGPNGANPYHEAGARVIQEGDMVVLDFGGIRDQYGSDTSRTVHVGEPTDEEREVHEVVRVAQQAGFEAVRPGVACQDIDRAVRRVIADAGFGDLFVHRTGHGIGLTIYEPPYMVEGDGRPLAPGMCFSIEPGIYVPHRFGVRIEDVVCVTQDGGRRLNTTARELRLVT